MSACESYCLFLVVDRAGRPETPHGFGMSRQATEGAFSTWCRVVVWCTSSHYRLSRSLTRRGRCKIPWPGSASAGEYNDEATRSKRFGPAWWCRCLEAVLLSWARSFLLFFSFFFFLPALLLHRGEDRYRDIAHCDRYLRRWDIRREEGGGVTYGCVGA